MYFKTQKSYSIETKLPCSSVLDNGTKICAPNSNADCFYLKISSEISNPKVSKWYFYDWSEFKKSQGLNLTQPLGMWEAYFS